MVAWNKFHQISGFIFTLGQRNSLCKKVKKVGSGISTWDWISANGWMCESGRWKYLLRSPSWSACWCTFSLSLQSPLNVKRFSVHQIMVIVRSVVSTHLMDKKVKGDYSKTSIHNQQFRDQNQFAMFGMKSNHSELKWKDDFECD